MLWRSTGAFLMICVSFSRVLWEVDSTHTRWWLLGCQCANWQSRNSVKDLVLNIYRGLFVGPAELNRLPVVKLARHTHREGQGAQRSYVENTVSNNNRVSNVGCCATFYSNEIFNTTVINRKRFNVVHFDNAYQFVPTGRCQANSSCGLGRCMQMYRHHWLLVWDERLTTWPPVTFLPVEVPSHCECVNLGS